MQLTLTTTDDLHALLERTGEAIDYREAWPHLFPATDSPPKLARRLIAEIVDGDDRFCWEDDARIGLSSWSSRSRSLEEVAFTVVDLETTGGTPGFSKITEIGAVRLEGGREAATFSSLVNPGVPIPATITKITGIDDATVAEAPPIEEVLPRFAAFAKDSVLVAHNAPFDLAFLDYELGRLCGETFGRPALDTLRMARRLCPQQRCSLAHLSATYGTRIKPSHRALHDAQATAELLLLFLSWLEERDVTTLEEVASFCEPEERRNYHKISLTDALPTCSGVYLLRDADDAVLLIGRAANIRRGARDHFLQRQTFRARQALELLARIEGVPTGSAFAALLLERRLVAKHKPPYNPRTYHNRPCWYVKLTNGPRPRLSATPNLRDDGSSFAGPFRRSSTARQFAACLASAYPLDQAAPEEERSRTIERLRRVLAGHGGELDAELHRRQEEYLRTSSPSRASQVQGQRTALERALRSMRRFKAAHHTDALLIYPARRTGRATIWGVRGGTIVGEWQVSCRGFDEGEAVQILTAIATAKASNSPLRSTLLEEMLLVSDWVAEHRHDAGVLDLRPLTGRRIQPRALAAELIARVRSVYAPSSPSGADKA